MSTAGLLPLASPLSQNQQQHRKAQRGKRSCGTIATSLVIMVCSLFIQHMLQLRPETDDLLTVEGPHGVVACERFPEVSLQSTPDPLERRTCLEAPQGSLGKARAIPTPPYPVPQPWPHPLQLAQQPPQTPACSSPNGPQDAPTPWLPPPTVSCCFLPPPHPKVVW